MERCLTRVQAWRAQLPIVGRGRQLVRVDINCQGKRITAPLTLVLALMKELALRAGAPSETPRIGPFSRFSRRPIPAEYMHFSKRCRRRGKARKRLNQA